MFAASPAQRRGAVVIAGTRHWLIWQHGPQTSVCLPISGQNEPLDRLDYVLREGDVPWLQGQRLMVQIAKASRLDIRGLPVISFMTADGMAAIQGQIERVARTQAVEARYREPLAA